MNPNTPRFNPVSEQLVTLTQLLTHVNVGAELRIHLANVLDGYVARSSCAFTQETIVVPGMDRRLLDLFVLAMRQYGILAELPPLKAKRTSSINALRAGTPRVVEINLIAHRHHDEEHPLNLNALVRRADSYLSAVATLWMIILNPDYARWLVNEQDEYKYILLPGITNTHVMAEDSEEELVLAVMINPGIMAIRWLATDFAPLGSVSPVVTHDPESGHLKPGPLRDDSSAEGE